MDNQHRHIKGYRELSAEEIAAMNSLKSLSERVGEACLSRRDAIAKMPTGSIEERAEKEEATRWLEAGEMQLQQGFMALVRSIARPTTF